MESGMKLLFNEGSNVQKLFTNLNILLIVQNLEIQLKKLGMNRAKQNL